MAGSRHRDRADHAAARHRHASGGADACICRAKKWNCVRYTEADLDGQVRNEAFGRLMRASGGADSRHIIRRRRSRGVALLDSRGRFAVKVAFDLYRQTLRHMESFGVRRVSTAAAAVPAVERAWITARSMAGPSRGACGRSWVPDGWHFDLALRVALAVAVVVSALFLARARLTYQAIPKLQKATERQPDCMVMIPARNEERFIGRAAPEVLPHDGDRSRRSFRRPDHGSRAGGGCRSVSSAGLASRGDRKIKRVHGGGAGVDLEMDPLCRC